MSAILDFFSAYQGEIIAIIAGAAGVKGIPAGWRGTLRLTRKFGLGVAKVSKALLQASTKQSDEDGK